MLVSTRDCVYIDFAIIILTSMTIQLSPETMLNAHNNNSHSSYIFSHNLHKYLFANFEFGWSHDTFYIKSPLTVHIYMAIHFGSHCSKTFMYNLTSLFSPESMITFSWCSQYKFTCLFNFWSHCLKYLFANVDFIVYIELGLTTAIPTVIKFGSHCS